LDALHHFVERTPAQRQRLIEPPSDLCRRERGRDGIAAIARAHEIARREIDERKRGVALHVLLEQVEDGWSHWRRKAEVIHLTTSAWLAQRRRVRCRARGVHQLARRSDSIARDRW